MGHDNGNPVLTMRRKNARSFSHAIPRWTILCMALAVVLLQGCGLIYDALQYAAPVAADRFDAICRRQRLQVGLAAEPFRPFVFPAIWTDEGARVTGLDVEIVKQITGALSEHCGTAVVPVLHLVRFRDLFTLLNEGQIDLFVSAVAANTPAQSRAGFGYSIPYFYNGGISGIVRRPEVLTNIRANLHEQEQQKAPGGLVANERALAGLTVAVQSWTASHLYAEANLSSSRLLLCDSLPAAFEFADGSHTPQVDVILGSEPILEYTVKRERNDWQLITRDSGAPLFLTRAHYSVVMAEESYRLRWFVNNVIFRLDDAGQLLQLRKRWLDDLYAFPRRASLEGLPFEAEKMVAHYNQGTCRATPER